MMCLRLFLLALLAVALCAAAPAVAGAAEPTPGQESTTHTCPRCTQPLFRNKTTGVLHCNKPDCRRSYFIDKAGQLQSMVSVANEQEAALLLNPPTPRGGVPSTPDATGNRPGDNQPLDPAKVGTQMFRDPQGGDGGMRVANAGEGWHPDGLDPQAGRIPKIELVAINCPVCAVPLKEPREGNRNYQAGVDRDFMRHSLGTFAVHSIVWLCPDCGYAALPEEFNQPVSAAFKQFMLSTVKPKMEKTMIDIVRNNSGDPHQTFKPSELAFHEYVDIKDLPDYLKYERAWDVQEQQLKLDPKFPVWDYAIQARVYTESSYACRDYLSGTIENGALVRVPIMQLSVQFIRAALVPRPDVIANPDAQYQNLLRMQDDFENGSPQQVGRPNYDSLAFFKFYLMLHKAGLEDRLGRPLDAHASLQLALKAIPSPESFDSADARLLLVPVLKQFQDEIKLRQELLKREQEYLRRAALNAIVALYLGRYPRKDLAPQVYLVAEQMRRVGAVRRSLAWFKFSQQLNGEDGPLTNWTREQMALSQFQSILPDDQDKALFEHLAKAWPDKNTQVIPPCPNPPTDYSLVPDTVSQPAGPANQNDPAVPGVNPLLANVRTIPDALKIFYRALAAHRKLTGSLPGTLDEMATKGVWNAADCPELTFKGKTLIFGTSALKFTFDAGGATGWGNKDHFLVIPAPDNQKAMYVLLGNGEVLDINTPEKPKP